MEFLRSAKILSVLTFFSRILGLFRDMISTSVLSAVFSDALYLAWTVPNVFRNLFGEGALSSAFIPVFSRVLEQDGRERAFLLARRVITAMALFLLLLLGVLLLLSVVLPADRIASAFGVDSEKLSQTLTLVRILLPYLAVVCLIAQCQGVLNSLRKFFLPALSPILLNAVWIIAALAAYLVFEHQQRRALFIACGIMAGGLLQMLLFIIALRLQRFPMKPALDVKDRDFRKVMALTLPMVLGVSAVQLNVLVDRGVAYALIPHDGGVTHLFVGNRLMQFPFALIGIALTTAVFPLLSRLSAAGDHEGMKENLSGALRISFFLSIPAAAGLALLAHPILSLFFQRGEFTPDRVEASVSALRGYVVGIPFLSSVMLLTRAFYAMSEWRRPLLVSGCLVVINIALDLVLVGPFAEAGVSLATSIAAILQSAALFCLLRRKMGSLGGPAILRGLLGTLLLTALLVVVVQGALALIGPETVEDTLPVKAVRVLLPVALGLLVYLASARRICRFEWKVLANALARKRGRVE